MEDIISVTPLWLPCLVSCVCACIFVRVFKYLHRPWQRQYSNNTLCLKGVIEVHPALKKKKKKILQCFLDPGCLTTGKLTLKCVTAHQYIRMIVFPPMRFSQRARGYSEESAIHSARSNSDSQLLWAMSANKFEESWEDISLTLLVACPQALFVLKGLLDSLIVNPGASVAVVLNQLYPFSGSITSHCIPARPNCNNNH